MLSDVFWSDVIQRKLLFFRFELPHIWCFPLSPDDYTNKTADWVLSNIWVDVSSLKNVHFGYNKFYMRSISNDTPLCKVGPSHQLRSGVTLTTPTEVLRPRPSAFRTSSGGRVVGLGPGICCLFLFSVVKAEVWGWIAEWVQVKSETPWDLCFLLEFVEVLLT